MQNIKLLFLQTQCLCVDSARYNRLDIPDGLQQAIHDLVLTLCTRALDRLDLLLGFLVGIVLGLLVAAGVL